MIVTRPSIASSLIRAQGPVRMAAIRYSSRLVKSLIPACVACGSAFQTTDSSVPGFQRAIDAEMPKKSYRAVKNSKFDSMFENLDDDKKLFLAQDALSRGSPGWSTTGISWSTASNDQLAKTRADEKARKKEEAKRCLCTRCIDIRTGKTPEIFQPYEDTESLLKNIPSSATIVNVVNASDFPTSVVSPRVLDPFGNRKGKILWVVNKADLVVTQKFKAAERALPYFQALLSEKYGIHPSKVFVTSSKLDWNTNSLYSALSVENYFVGYTNAGKSNLVLNLAHKYGLPEFQPTPLQQNSSNSMPWSTQSSRIIELEAKKLIVDMPSFPEEGNGIYGAVTPSEVRRLSVGRQLLKDPGMYNIKRIVAKRPHQLINIGGLLAIKQESNSSDNNNVQLIAWTIIRDSQNKCLITRSVDKVKELGAAPEDPPAFKHWRLVDSSIASTLKKRKTYTFHGEGLSLAIRGLGTIQLNASGKIPAEGVTVSVYAVENVGFERRPNILPYLRDETDPEQHSEYLAGIKDSRF